MIETPFNYTGSKFKLLEQILPEFDYTKPYFVDLFMGGGSVYTTSGVAGSGGNGGGGAGGLGGPGTNGTLNTGGGGGGAERDNGGQGGNGGTGIFLIKYKFQ